ncbi:hypothetical protein NAPIS_ORF01890 [Vairimorpha apis BRL 01]|uniref:MIP18 family-like domain-containing protein n=1 Tax=Vairimorpha apis BRL 01 TaxID=1037528 RepID=T0MBE7_9MICR|nr:hypothetical protein NAPIS_ORF01890 [Vairimorpha apis BRL 01]
MNLVPNVKNDSFEPRAKFIFNKNGDLNISIDSIFELIRDIKDPEHDFTLEQLNVVKKEYISIFEFTKDDECLNVGLPVKCLMVRFVPTIPHCSMAAIIGLSLIYILKNYIKDHIIKIEIVLGTHVNDKLINKQLNDKDRVQAAFENEALNDVINDCTANIFSKYNF